MKENEFDILVRNLLQDARESVSPSVWEGVSSGLARRRRIVAFYRWGGIAAAAAAVVAAVVLLWPRSTQHSNPTISIAEVSGELAPVQEEASPSEAPLIQDIREEVVPQQVVRRQRVAVVRPAVSEAPLVAPEPAVEEEPRPETPAKEVSPVREETPVQPQALPDQDAFNRLAFAETQKPSFDRFSLTVSGNLEDRRRAAVPSSGFVRHSAPPRGAAEGIYNESPEVSFSLPFSAGVGLKINFSPRWAVGVGVRYTNLSRTFVADYVGEGFRYSQTDVDNHQHWLGVPVHFYYDIVNRGRWRVHTFAGAGMEFLVDNDYLVHGPQKDFHYHSRGTTPQFSGDLGLGIEFRITPWMGIYLDPSFRYYFRPDLQPRSLRTIQPLRFDLEAGVRFTLGQK